MDRNSCYESIGQVPNIRASAVRILSIHRHSVAHSGDEFGPVCRRASRVPDHRWGENEGLGLGMNPIGGRIELKEGCWGICRRCATASEVNAFILAVLTGRL